MEKRNMSSHHRYKSRDFEFGQLLMALRKKAGLTQEEVALRVGVGEKSIRNWEGGTNYPTELNLQRLIELYLAKNAFVPGQEQDEARALWEQLRESASRHIGLFDERWFVRLLTERQARIPRQALPTEGSQTPLPPPSPEQPPSQPPLAFP